MELPIGLMQGRLTPSPDGRLQFFPKDNWENELTLAASLGFDCLEWIFEADDYNKNPLLAEGGLAKIARLSHVSGIKVSSICADYFMDFPCHYPDPEIRREAITILRTLVAKASGLGAKTILIPVLERSELRNETDKRLLAEALVAVWPWFESLKVDLALECSLPAKEIAKFIGSLGMVKIKVYYDVGNAVSYGFDPAREILELGDLIGGVHIKDRTLNGSSVLLGWGSVDFGAVFRSLSAIDYNRPVILQAARDSEDRVRENAQRNLNFIRDFLKP